MSTGEKREKTSSVDSGNSQNYFCQHQAVNKLPKVAYTCPITVVCRDFGWLRQLKDALLEDELRV